MVLCEYKRATDTLHALAHTKDENKIKKYIEIVREASKNVATQVELLWREDPELQQTAANIYDFDEHHADELKTSKGRKTLNRLLTKAEKAYEKIAEWWL